MNRVLELCHDLPVKKVPAGEALMSQGRTNLQMAVLKDGKVEILRDGQQIAMTDEPGAIFGEMSVILDRQHSAMVQVLEDSEFYMIEDPSAFLWERSEFNFELLKILASRLARMDGIVANLDHNSKVENEVVSLLRKMVDEAAHQGSE